MTAGVAGAGESRAFGGISGVGAGVVAPDVFALTTAARSDLNFSNSASAIAGGEVKLNWYGSG